MRIIAQADAAKQQSAETRRVAATEQISVSEVDGHGQNNVDSRHPLHSRRSFSGCHPTGEEPQSTDEIAPAETNASDLKKRTQFAAAQAGASACDKNDYDGCRRRVAATERTSVSEMDGIPQDKTASHPLHSLRSFSCCHPTPACARKSETRNSKLKTGEAHDHGSELKKRSQCAAPQKSTSACSNKSYGDCGRPGREGNKAGQGQLQADLAESRTD